MSIEQPTRRALITGAFAILAMPSIVKAENLMKIYISPKTIIGGGYEISMDGEYVTFHEIYIDYFDNYHFDKKIFSKLDYIAAEQTYNRLNSDFFKFRDERPLFEKVKNIKEERFVMFKGFDEYISNII